MGNHNFIIIGAGIVGLATAYKILERKPGCRVLILEKEERVAKHQTGNNSGVIHSGIYYKPGGLKAKNCRKGYAMLLEFCDENEIEYDICGKVIVATKEEELPLLDDLYNRGLQNGLSKIKRLSREELKAHEPKVNGVAGIHVPYTGIIDYTEVCEVLKKKIIELGGEIRFSEEVVGIVQEGKGKITVTTKSNRFYCDKLVSCAGLFSDKVAKMTHPKLPIRIIPFRGEYYELKESKKNLVRNLIYPVPNPNFPFLGVHYTRMISGKVEAGPNAVFAFKREGYKKSDISVFDTLGSLVWPGFIKVAFKYWSVGLGEFWRSYNKSAFVKALQGLIPEIRKQDLIPGGAGVRAQACDKHGGLLDDFYFMEDEDVLHVCNAPSPAATSSLAIGEYIANKVLGR